MATTSFWQRTTQDPEPYAELPSTADVVVIGGGIVGVSTAYWLAQAGLRPVLIEQTGLARGATGRNGGFITLGAADSYANIGARYGRDTARSIWQFTAENRAHVRDIAAREGFDFDGRAPGVLTLALGAEEAADMQRNVRMLAEDGFGDDFQIVDHAGVQDRARTTVADEVSGAQWKPNAMLIHSAKLVYGLAMAAARRATRFSIAKATGLAPAPGGVTVTTDRGTVHAGAVAVCGNAWTDALVPALKGIIVPVRGQMLGYEPLPRAFDVGMGASVTPTGEYWQQTVSGAIVIGGCRAIAPDREWDVRDDVLNGPVQSALEEVLPRLFPHLDGLRVAERWSGPMAFTRDYLPVIDQIAGMPGAWVAGGFSGSGMPFGVNAGRQIALAIQTGSRPEALQPFSSSRAGLRP